MQPDSLIAARLGCCPFVTHMVCVCVCVCVCVLCVWGCPSQACWPTSIAQDTCRAAQGNYRRILCRIHGRPLACCTSPKALGYTPTCIDADAMQMMQISKIHNALHPFISFLPAPSSEQAQCKNFLLRSYIVLKSSISRKQGHAQLQWHHVCTPPPPPCISYALVQATAGVGTVIIVYVIELRTKCSAATQDMGLLSHLPISAHVAPCWCTRNLFL